MPRRSPPARGPVASVPAPEAAPRPSFSEPPRRLQRMGAVTIGVSLPRSWVGAHGLSAGSPVQLRALPDGSILVRNTNPPRGPQRTVIPAEEDVPAEHLFRQLIGAYVGGASEFVIHEAGGIRPETRATAKSFVRRTIQPEIVSEEGDTLLLQEVTQGSRLPIPLLLRRMVQVVVELHRDAGTAWTRPPPRLEETLQSRDDEVDRHAWLAERLLTLKLGSEAPALRRGSTFEDPLQTLLLVRALERVADHAVNIAEHGRMLAELNLPKRFPQGLTDYHQQVVQHLQDAYQVCERPDAARANEVIDAGEALHATHATLSENFLARSGTVVAPPTAIASLGLVLMSIDRTTAYAQDIAQIGLDQAAAREIGAAEALATDVASLSSRT